MRLSAEQISQNYTRCYQLTAQLLNRKFRGRGFDADPEHQQFVDLCQSVVGHESVVVLLQKQQFDPSIYQSVLEEAIDEVKRLFFPDTCKKRFISLDALQSDFPDFQTVPKDGEDVEAPAISEEAILENFRKTLSAESFTYFRNCLLPSLPVWGWNLQYLFCNPGNHSSRFAEIEKKLLLFKKFYPEGIVSIENLNGLNDLSGQQVVNAFLNVYLEIERTFPPNFLQRDGEKRSALIVRFLIEKILNIRPETILELKDETFFIQHKLQNVYRFFNYSANRVLRNAYPAMIPPWLHSRSSARYWENPRNRVEAVRWLVEHRLNISPGELYKHPLAKQAFARNGLSYMFNRHYNSVSKALSEAYPHLEPWEIGKVPYDYWNEENIARAVRWMVKKKGWDVTDLPAKLRSREFNRKTFSEFGLATLFEKKFAKNIYRAVSAAWPGQFEPWEMGKVPSEYWESPENVYNASKWIAEQEGIAVHQIVPAVRKKNLNISILRKYSIGAALKRLSKGNLEVIFAPFFWREHRNFLHEHKLLRKINLLKNAERKSNLLHFLLYGLFMYDVQEKSLQNIHRYERIAHRIHQRRLTLYSE